MARVGFLVDDFVEDLELRMPLARLGEAGHEVIVIGLERGREIRGKRGGLFRTDRGIHDVRADELDALVIPGGYAPDRLRTHGVAVQLVRDLYDAGKPVAAVCHGPALLIEADVVNQRRLTSWRSIRTDLMNAGADWVDEEVVEDENLITSRKPGDLAAFSEAILRQLERRAQPPPPASRLVQGPAGRTGEQPFVGGEGEGRPETRDIGGLQQRDVFGAPARHVGLEGAVEEDTADVWDIEGGFVEEHITLADVEEHRRLRAKDIQAQELDRGREASEGRADNVDAPREHGPDDTDLR